MSSDVKSGRGVWKTGLGDGRRMNKVHMNLSKTSVPLFRGAMFDALGIQTFPNNSQIVPVGPTEIEEPHRQSQSGT